MGAGNVAAVFVHGSRLSAVPFRLLVYMALVSLDADDPPRYWGGIDALAEAVGHEPDHAGRASALRALATLKAAGFVTVVRGSAPGVQAEYALYLTATPDDPTGTAERDPNRYHSAIPDDGERVTLSGTNGSRSAQQQIPLSSSTGHAQRDPEEYRRTGEQEQEEGSPESPRHVEVWRPATPSPLITMPKNWPSSVSRRRSTTDERVAAGLELAARYEAEEAREAEMERQRQDDGGWS